MQSFQKGFSTLIIFIGVAVVLFTFSGIYFISEQNIAKQRIAKANQLKEELKDNVSSCIVSITTDNMIDGKLIITFKNTVSDQEIDQEKLKITNLGYRISDEYNYSVKGITIDVPTGKENEIACLLKKDPAIDLIDYDHKNAIQDNQNSNAASE